MRSAVYGHLAWTAQNASGNRGDDLRALKLAELQPAVMLHPNKDTAVPCVYGLQSEEKAGKRGMRTVSPCIFLHTPRRLKPQTPGNQSRPDHVDCASGSNDVSPWSLRAIAPLHSRHEELYEGHGR